MPPRKNPAGRWEQQKHSPPNVLGRRRRLYVVCPPEANTPAFCRELMRQAIERHVRGVSATSMTFERFAREHFLLEYPAARNLRPSSRALLAYLLERVIIPEIGRSPLSAVDAASVARLVGKLRDMKREARIAAAPRLRPLAPTTIATALKVLERLAHESTDFPRRTEIVDAARPYLESCRERLTAGSFAIYRQMIELHLLPHLGGKRLADIGHELRAELAGKLADGTPGETSPLQERQIEARRFSDQTLRHVVMAIKGVLGWAATTKALPAAPAIMLPKVADARRPQPYTQEEARALIAAATDDEERALFLLTFDGGLRKSEILGLEWSQVVFDRNLILVDRQRYRGRESETKSGRERSVPMSETLSAALKKIRHLRFGNVGRRWVFSDDTGRPREEHWIRSIAERARRKAKLRRVRWHDHRHTFSTMRTDGGIAPFVLQALLGHADIRTTQRYVHASAEHLASVLDDPATKGRAS